MRKLCSIFAVNGNPLFIPDSPLSVSFSDVRSSDSGADELGITHNFIVRKNVGKWNFVYKTISEEEKNYMESLFEDAEFEFTYPSKSDSTVKSTCRAYRSGYGIAYYDMVQGLWKNYKFTISEC